MAGVLVDTSVWIDYLRGRPGAACDLLDDLLDIDEAVLCGIVELELLQGCLKPERARLHDLLQSLPWAETVREDYVQAGDQLAELRSRGVSIPATDGLIASVCQRLKLPLLTSDKHFRLFKNLHLAK